MDRIETICSIVSSIGMLVFMWQYVKLKRINQELLQNTELLQGQLIEQINKNLKKQDNFCTDPVE